MKKVSNDVLYQCYASNTCVSNTFAELQSPSREVFQAVQFGKVSGGSDMRTHDEYDARDSYERARDAMGENV